MQIQVNTDRHIKGTTALTNEVEGILQEALDRYIDRVTRLEVFLSDENSSQKAGDSDKRCVIEARLGGLRPITVSHEGSSISQAVNGATDKLEKTLKRTLQRKGSLYKRRVAEREEWTAAGPRLQQDVTTGQQEDFKKVLRPLLGRLGQHARRELRIMEANGTLYPGQIMLSDLLDETVTRAWLEFADRPQWLALDLWLTKIVDQVLEEQNEQNRRNQMSVDRSAEAVAENVPQVDEQEWWMWLLGEGDAEVSENAIVSGESTWAEGILEAEELLHRIHLLLGELPTLQRRAFVLNVFEAYEIAEIAMLQDRPQEEVQTDIQSVRDRLQERLGSAARPQSAIRKAPEALAGEKRKV